METKDIKIEANGSIYRCRTELTVDVAIQEIRSWHCHRGGGITENGIPVPGSQVIGSLTGALSFAGGWSTGTDQNKSPTDPKQTLHVFHSISSYTAPLSPTSR